MIVVLIFLRAPPVRHHCSLRVLTVLVVVGLVNPQHQQWRCLAVGTLHLGRGD